MTRPCIGDEPGGAGQQGGGGRKSCLQQQQQQQQQQVLLAPHRVRALSKSASAHSQRTPHSPKPTTTTPDICKNTKNSNSESSLKNSSSTTFSSGAHSVSSSSASSSSSSSSPNSAKNNNDNNNTGTSAASEIDASIALVRKIINSNMHQGNTAMYGKNLAWGITGYRPDQQQQEVFPFPNFNSTASQVPNSSSVEKSASRKKEQQEMLKWSTTQWIKEEDSCGITRMSLRDPLPLYMQRKGYTPSVPRWPANIKTVPYPPDFICMTKMSLQRDGREKYYSPETATDFEQNVSLRNEKIANMIIGCERGRMSSAFEEFRLSDSCEEKSFLDHSDYELSSSSCSISSERSECKESGEHLGLTDKYPRVVYICENGASLKKGSRASGASSFVSSSSTSTKDIKPWYTLKGPGDLTLQFESRFESGNLLKAVQTGRFEYALVLKQDINTQRPCTQWFYFRVKNMRANIEYKFNIINYVKNESLYNSGLKPAMYSEIGNSSLVMDDHNMDSNCQQECSFSSQFKSKKNVGGWTRVGNNIEYKRNGLSYSALVNFGNDPDSIHLMYPLNRPKSSQNFDGASDTEVNSASQSSSQNNISATPTSSPSPSPLKSSSSLLNQALHNSSGFPYTGYKVNSNVKRPNSAPCPHKESGNNSLLCNSRTSIGQNSGEGNGTGDPLAKNLGFISSSLRGAYSTSSKGSQANYQSSNDSQGGGCSSSPSAISTSSGRSYYTLSFTVKFPHSNDTCYFAHCYPYTYSQLQQDIHSILNDESKCQYIKHKVLCTTLANNNCDLLTITQFADTNRIQERRGIVITGRVHPGESNASWGVKGLIEFLVGPSPDAKILRENFIFKIVPMLNPDGVIIGNTRCSLAGVDLNRCWSRPQRTQHPTIFYTKQMIRKLRQTREVTLYCDFHGHSKKHNIFMYGCERNSGQMASPWRLHERVFPRMFGWNSNQLFSYPDCNFAVQKCKEATGRVVMWREMDILNSFTLEISYAGWSSKPFEGGHFSVKDLLRVGTEFGDALLDYCDPLANRIPMVINIIDNELHDQATKRQKNELNYEMSDASSYGSDDDDGETENDSKRGADSLKSSAKKGLEAYISNTVSSDGPVKIPSLERSDATDKGRVSTGDACHTGNETKNDIEESSPGKLTNETLKLFNRSASEKTVAKVSGIEAATLSSGSPLNNRTNGPEASGRVVQTRMPNRRGSGKRRSPSTTLSSPQQTKSTASLRPNLGPPKNSETRLQKRAELQRQMLLEKASKEEQIRAEQTSDRMRQPPVPYNSISPRTKAEKSYHTDSKSCRKRQLENEPHQSDKLPGLADDGKSAGTSKNTFFTENSDFDEALSTVANAIFASGKGANENPRDVLDEINLLIQNKPELHIEIYDSKKEGLVSFTDCILKRMETLLKPANATPNVKNVANIKGSPQGPQTPSTLSTVRSSSSFKSAKNTMSTTSSYQQPQTNSPSALKDQDDYLVAKEETQVNQKSSKRSVSSIRTMLTEDVKRSADISALANSASGCSPLTSGYDRKLSTPIAGPLSSKEYIPSPSPSIHTDEKGQARTCSSSKNRTGISVPPSPVVISPPKRPVYKPSISEVKNSMSLSTWDCVDYTGSAITSSSISATTFFSNGQNTHYKAGMTLQDSGSSKASTTKVMNITIPTGNVAKISPENSKISTNGPSSMSISYQPATEN
eukprot:Nk52_evm23s2118 gene=Nk52_evmTU23s2118